MKKTNERIIADKKEKLSKMAQKYYDLALTMTLHITRETPVDAGFHELLNHGTKAFPAEAEILDLGELPGGRVNWHWHEDVQFFLVLQGTVDFTVSRTHHRLRAGDGLFVNSGVLHTAVGGSGCRYVCFDIGSVFLTLFAGSVLETQYVTPYLGKVFYEGRTFTPEGRGVDAVVLKRLRRLYEIWQNQPLGWEYLAVAEFMQLWVAILTEAPTQPAALSEQILLKTVSRMMDYVHANMAEKILLSDLARYVGKSPSECCRQFKAVTTMTLGEYIESVRLEKAAQLLKTGLQPVSRIGEIVGYPTCAYFIRRFKRKIGMTPARYRKTWVKSTTTA